MPWAHETEISRSVRTDPWGFVVLTCDTSGWSGCVRDWSSAPAGDVNGPTLEAAEAAAEAVLFTLRLAWLDYIRCFGRVPVPAPRSYPPMPAPIVYVLVGPCILRNLRVKQPAADGWRARVVEQVELDGRVLLTTPVALSHLVDGWSYLTVFDQLVVYGQGNDFPEIEARLGSDKTPCEVP